VRKIELASILPHCFTASVKHLPVVLVCALLAGGCVSSHKTYLPPSNAKVAASTKKVMDGALNAHRGTQKVKTHVEAAQKHNDALLVTGLDLQQKLDAIIKIAPPELQSALAEVKGDATEMQDHADGMQTELTGARSELAATEAFQVKLDQDITDWKKNMAEYYANAQGLADNATQERENLITVQKERNALRFTGFLWKAGAVVGVLLIILFIVLKLTGKLALGAAAVASKIP